MSERPSYYAIITADVRYDKRLSASEKLLFGEITCLTHSTGECWANNAYFADLYERRKETISVWIRNLVKYGYISSRLVYKDGTKQVEKRVITLPRLIDRPSQEKSRDPLAKNRKDNSTSINNTSITKDTEDKPPAESKESSNQSPEPKAHTPKRKPPAKFVAPNLQEVEAWALDWARKKNKSEIAVMKQARAGFEYYNRMDWHDATGRKVKSWKLKIVAVWFTDEKLGATATQPQREWV